MRLPTSEELDRWLALARERGDLDAAGRWIYNRVDLVEERFEGVDVVRMTFALTTPWRAEEYTEALERKTPPIPFDRTAADEILFPGRWWRSMWARISESERVSERRREVFTILARDVDVDDILLPATTDTIVVGVRDTESSEPVLYEALPPEMRVTINVRRATARG